MLSDVIREKLQNIIRGELQERSTDSCTAILNLLCKSFGTSPTVKSEFESKTIIKEEQVCFLKSYAQLLLNYPLLHVQLEMKIAFD
jgi:hypothetical protein